MRLHNVNIDRMHHLVDNIILNLIEYILTVLADLPYVVSASPLKREAPSRPKGLPASRC